MVGFLLLSLSHLLPQEVIDIFEGVRDDQALRMAANLGFKGPLERQVMGLDWIAAKEIVPLECVSLSTVALTVHHLPPTVLYVSIFTHGKSESNGHDDSANAVIKHFLHAFRPQQTSPVINSSCWYIVHINCHL